MQINVNCKMNDNKAWCKDTRVKKSFFGLFARVCSVHNGEDCPYQDPHSRPKLHPPGHGIKL